MPTHLTYSHSKRYGHMVIAKETIEREAKAAAHAGKSLDDACPYPWGTDAATHFKAVYLLHLDHGQPTKEGGAA